MWTAKLKAVIQSGESNVPVAEIEADDRCELGKWLKGELPAALRNSPYYAQVSELHQRFHRAAGRVFKLATRGKSEEALRAMETDGEFNEASKALVAMLRAWNQSIPESLSTKP